MHETAGYRMSDRRAEVAEGRTKKGGWYFHSDRSARRSSFLTLELLAACIEQQLCRTLLFTIRRFSACFA